MIATGKAGTLFVQCSDASSGQPALPIVLKPERHYEYLAVQDYCHFVETAVLGLRNQHNIILIISLAAIRLSLGALKTKAVLYCCKTCSTSRATLLKV